MKIEVAILNYNGKELLEKCLPSVIQAAKKSIYGPKVVIVDNCSSDASQDFVRENFPEVEFLSMRENRVLCSLNDAAKKSDADIMIFLNNDLKVAENFIDPLIDNFLHDKKTFLSAARVYNFDGTEVEEGRTKPFWRLGVIRGISHYKGYMNELDTDSLTLMAGFGAFDRKKFLELGGYDPLYLPGILEDMDICFRAWRSGWRCYYQPKSKVFHMGKASFNKRFGNRQRLAISHRNTYFFIWKNIRNKKFLFENIVLVPLRLLYAFITFKWEIIKGFFWFIVRLPEVLAARQLEKQNKHYILSEKEVFDVCASSKAPRKIERLIAGRFDILADTFPERIEKNDARLNAILEKMGNFSGKKVLEVGCGKGRVARVLSGLGADIFGIDISEKLLQHTKGIKPFGFMQAEAYSIPFKDNTFDIIILLEVIEHIPLLENALAEIIRVLKPDGKLIIVDRNKSSLNNRRFLIPNLLIKRYHELKNEWMYPKDFPYREIWFNPSRVNGLLKNYFKDCGYSFILSDAETQKWWHFIFRFIIAARYFVLWHGYNKFSDSGFKYIPQKAILKEFASSVAAVVEKVAPQPSIYHRKEIPKTLTKTFCLRIDADEYHPDSFHSFYGLFEKNSSAITIFFNINSFKAASEQIIQCKNIGLDIQSHGFYHHTYNDYRNNRYNIRKAKIFLNNLGIRAKGFAAPMGKWNAGLMRALEDEGYEYSSDFSYDYLSPPSFPFCGGKYSQVLEIPIFPVAPELFFQKKMFNLEEVTRYFKNAIDEMALCNLPVIIYAHTSVYAGDVIKLLAEVSRYALNDKGLRPVQMSEISRLWRQSLASSTVLEKLILPRQDYLGLKAYIPVYKRVKRKAREILEPERMQLIESFFKSLRNGKVCTPQI